MGSRRDPWFIEASPFDPMTYGAFPTYEFDHQQRKGPSRTKRFRAPELGLPEGVTQARLPGRLSLLESVDHPRALIDAVANKRAV